MAEHEHCDHDHNHDHDHHDQGHGHHHHGPVNPQSRSFQIAIALNTVFVGVEFAYGTMANSTALMADAGHNLSDVLALVLAMAAGILSRRMPTDRYTYGLRSTSILASLINAMVLLMVCGAIAWEAVQRLAQAPEVATASVMAVAALGIVINGISAWLVVKDSAKDINIRGAYLHMASDAVVSLGVVVAGLVIMVTGWNWLDPLVSLVITVVIVMGTWGLLRQSVQLALSAIPENIDVEALETFLRQSAGVTDIHDLHIWGMSTTESALTVHLVMPGGYPGDAFMDQMTNTLKDRFSIHHSTLQVEMGTTDHTCALHG